MRHWWLLATRNWSAKPGRSAAVVLAVALGVGTVITVVSIYLSVETAIGQRIVDNWVGRSNITIESPRGHWGSIRAGLADQVSALDNVAVTTSRYKSPMRVRIPEGVRLSARRYAVADGFVQIDAIGVQPQTEYRFRTYQGLNGRGLGDDDREKAVVERQLARDLGLEVGDSIRIEAYIDEPPVAFQIVGTYEGKRVAFFQRPTVYIHLQDMYRMGRSRGKVTVIDVIVNDDQPGPLEATAAKIRTLLSERGEGYEVITATSKLNELRQARRFTRLVLLLFSSVALLTSFFIIVTTMGMGMVERIRVLGALRCVGVTRADLGGIVLAEIMPLGIAGIVLGVPVGWCLTRAGVAMVPDLASMVERVRIGFDSILPAGLGGLLTTLAAAGVILLQVLRVTPLEATRPLARGDRMGTVIVAGLAGVLLWVCHWMMIEWVDPVQWVKPLVAMAGMGSLYGAFVLLTPLVVAWGASWAVWALAPVLGIRRNLARDQLGRAPWRSAGVCWMLMVGLSLVVYFAIRGESIAAAWDFPSKMASTFVWTRDPVPRRVTEDVIKLAAVSAATPVNDVMCSVKPKRASLLDMFSTRSIFVAGDPDTFLAMARLDFLEGTQTEAEAKFKQGGYVLLPAEAAHSFGYHLGDRVPVTVGSTTHEFTVAGVVRSPAMDIAVSYFQADTYMMIAAASSVLGTLDDLERYFGIDSISMLLMNVDPVVSEPPEAFASDIPPDTSDRAVAGVMGDWLGHLADERGEVGRLVKAFDAYAGGRRGLGRQAYTQLLRYVRALRPVTEAWGELTADQRWELFQENLVLGRVRSIMHRPRAMAGSLRRLKQDIDSDIRTATLIISAIPLICILVASIGVANLMMVNVTSRSRPIAILRAVGATKGQIARLVLVEAMVLGVLGCAIGVVLGVQSAVATNTLTERLLGLPMQLAVPWTRVIGAVVVTWTICVVSGIAPARRASRNNIIDAISQG